MTVGTEPSLAVVSLDPTSAMLGNSVASVASEPIVTEIAPVVPTVNLGATGEGVEIMKFSTFIGYQRISVKSPVFLSVQESTS